jgi:hypothetical protein
MPATDQAVDIGSRLELLLDEHLIDKMTSGAHLQMHRPTRREVVLKTDASWEGNACAFQSVIRDGDLCRMYYRGLHYRHSGQPAQALADHERVLCMAESDDGINWRKPELGVHEFAGSKANNIVLTQSEMASFGGDAAHTSVFLDANPDCPADARYKVTVVGGKPKGMYTLGSPDGVHFTLMGEGPSVTDGAFDSQNLMFWDPVRAEYREYHRGFLDGNREILTAVSPDILSFPDPEWVTYPGAPREQLYTNAIQPYYRAPHVFVGFPMRYVDPGWTDPAMDLPGLDERLVRASSAKRYGTAITDGLFMSSRDGITFKRWGEAFIRPGPRQSRSWVYGDNFTFWGMVETPSEVEDAPDEISMYAVDGYWEGTYSEVRRYTLRVDGFVSANAPLAGGELVTRPMVFQGGNLTVNAETSAAGGIRVEIQDEAGKPIPGYGLADCPAIMCDSLRHTVRWNGGGDVRGLAGRPIRLRFRLSDADLYAFQFVPYVADPERPDVSQLSKQKADPTA